MNCGEMSDAQINGSFTSDSTPLLGRKEVEDCESIYRGELNLAKKYDYELAKAQLKASSRTSGLLSGFAMVALVEMQYEQDTPAYLLIILGVITTLLVSVHLLALMLSTCIRPYMEAYGCSEDSPHEKLRFFIDLSWLISTCIGLILFLVEIGIILLVKFEGVKNYTAGIVTTAMLVPVVIIFCYLAYRIQTIKTLHTLERLRVKAIVPNNFYAKNKAFASNIIPVYHV